VKFAQNNALNSHTMAAMTEQNLFLAAGPGSAVITAKSSCRILSQALKNP
jgi:hypothetical protein